jgi:hypothetical protein
VLKVAILLATEPNSSLKVPTFSCSCADFCPKELSLQFSLVVDLLDVLRVCDGLVGVFICGTVVCRV